MTSRFTESLAPRGRFGGTPLIVLLAGIGGVAGSYAVAAFTPEFIAGPIAGFMARRLPAKVITFAIVVLGDLGSQLNLLLALFLSVLLLAAISLVGVIVGRWLRRPLTGSIAAAVLGTGAAFAVTGALVASIAAGLGTGVVLTTAELVAGPSPVGSHSSGRRLRAVERRRLIGGVASALAFVIWGYVSGGRSGDDRTTTTDVPLDVDESVTEEIGALLGEADEKSFAVAGLEPLVSDDFYEVDINAINPTIDAQSWTLTVTGAVEEAVAFTYDDLRELPAENRFVTLRCVGESLNGTKMDNALWTGVPIMDLLEPAVPADECCVMFRAADGYYEQFPLSALRNGFLAYGMNGNRLPRGHGYPVRALIPGHWGEINVKWITEIEVLEEPQDGYWEERGWHGTGPVETVAKLHVVDELDDGRQLVAGHAYAGTRGIQRVEVSIDDGETWNDAELSEPIPGDDVWRQWQYRYEPPPGAHEVVVRATDGTGELQPEDERNAFPSGPTGWVSRTVGR